MKLVSSVKSRILLGFGAMLIILGASSISAILMIREYNAAVSDMREDSKTASLIQDARSDAGNAALLLQRYVITGDETLVPEIRDSAASAVAAISEAARAETEVDPATAIALAQVAAGAQPLADGADAIIAQRQSGDAIGAAAAIDEIAPQFHTLRIILGQQADAELVDLANRSAEADRAGNLTLALLIATGLAGALTATAASFFIARSIVKPLAVLDSTARRIGEGDLDARAEPRGPRELVTLGRTLNDMAIRLQEREQELMCANEELRERNRQLLEARKQAATDGLTNIPNHRTFQEAVRSLVPNGSQSPVSLVMLDIDGFKAINDRLGHQVGDDILCAVSSLLARISGDDRVYRYGGDEFAVLLPDTPIEDAGAIAEQLRTAINGTPMGNGRPVTISLGVASYPTTASSPEELIYEADAAMYAAKMAGKNRVARWDRLPSAAPLSAQAKGV